MRATFRHHPNIDDGNWLPGNHLQRQEICARLVIAPRRFVCIVKYGLRKADMLKHTVFGNPANTFYKFVCFYFSRRKKEHE
ncbi:hypothetical protein CR51_38315 [Caballeronia megalochromosomata]|nr:hypothetical protein CR51_38315 [Caballeronia megalochromosomata]